MRSGMWEPIGAWLGPHCTDAHGACVQAAAVCIVAPGLTLSAEAVSTMMATPRAPLPAPAGGATERLARRVCVGGGLPSGFHLTDCIQVRAG